MHQDNDSQGGIQTMQDWYLYLFRVNELGTEIIIVYVYDTLETGDKLELMDTIEWIKK